MKKLLFILLLSPLLLIAQEPTLPIPRPNTYVNDLAGVLNSTEIEDLNTQIYYIERNYKVQFAIIIVKTTGDMSIEDFARKIGMTWKVGADRKGLVYVAALNDHKQRLEVAENLEATITDVRAKELTDIVKAYKQHGHLYLGLHNMTQSLTMMLQPPLTTHVLGSDDTLIQYNVGGPHTLYGSDGPSLTYTEAQKQLQKQKEKSIILPIVISLSVFSLIVLFILYRKRRKQKLYLIKEQEEKARKERIWNKINERIDQADLIAQMENRSLRIPKPIRTYNVHPDRIPDHHRRDDGDNSLLNFGAGYIADSASKNDYTPSSASSSSSTDSSFGNWSSDSSSSDSGFSGGGATNDL